MYLKISNMFRTLICAVFSTTINKLRIYILLSDNLYAICTLLLGRFLIHSTAKEIVKCETPPGRFVAFSSSKLCSAAESGCLISNRVYPLSVDGQLFASTTATASVSAGNAARLLWRQSARTMTLKEFILARRARHCNDVLIHFHSVTHS
jgi:hypothetical protein